MSAETELYALLSGAAPVIALAGSRISADRIEQGTARPFIVFSRVGTEAFGGLSGEIFDTRVTLEVQAWADTRAQAESLADAINAAIVAADHFVTGRSSGYDGELDLEATILTVEWWPS